MASPRRPLVGRRPQLRVLHGLLERVETGTPAAALVAGEAGAGKTRLLDEFAADATARGARVLIGGCLPVGGDLLPYAPFVEALRGELAHTDAADGAATASVRARRFEEVFDTLLRLSRDAPLLLVLEDLHWADPTTLQLLTFVIRNLRTGRLGVLATYRTDELRRDHPLGPVVAELGRDDTVTRVEVPRMDADEVAELLAGLAGGPVDPDVSRRIHARSQGNPFFAEELFAASRGGAADGPLPATLHQIILARVTGVGPAAAAVLRLCAVAGGRADDTLLAAASDAGEHDLAQGLREAVDHALLVVSDDGSCYAFRHALVAEAVYADLLPFERSRLHLRLAEALAAHPSPGDSSRAAAIAGHRLAALDVAGALPAFLEAGAAAQRVGAFAEAGQHFATALQLWDRVDDAAALTAVDRAFVLQEAAHSKYWAGDPERAVSLIRSALAEAPEGDLTRRALLTERLASYLWAVGAGADALRVHDEAVALVPASPPSPARASVLAASAHALVSAGRYERARARAAEAVRIAVETGAEAEEGRARTTLGIALAEQGEVKAGVAEIIAGRDTADRRACTDDLLRAWLALGDAYARAGLHDQAVAKFGETAEVAQRLGVGRTAGTRALALRADSLMRLGCFDEAGEVIAAASQRGAVGMDGLVVVVTRARHAVDTGALDVAEQDLEAAAVLAAPGAVDAGVQGWLADARAGLAWSRGDLDGAAEAVAAGLAALDGTDDRRHRALLCVLGLRIEADRAGLARVTRDGGAEARARASGARLAGLLAEVSPPELPTGEAERASGHAELRRLAGEDDVGCWRAAATIWHGLGDRWAEAYSDWRAAEVAVAEGRTAEAATWVAEARGLMAELRDGPLMRELDALARRARLTVPPLDAAAGGAAEAAGVTGGAGGTGAAPPGLTPRELEVLALLARGHTNAEIGRALFISDKTASVHVSNLLRKLGVRRRVEAAAIAHRLRLHPSPTP